MKLLKFFTLLLFFNFTNSFSQETQNVDPYWELLFKNDRKAAMSKFQKSKKGGIADELITELIRSENGTFSNAEDFMKNIQQHPDFEYYLYALWNQNFFFDSYLNAGFNKKNSSNINAIDLDKVKNPTVKEALLYLQSIAAKHVNDWKKFEKMNGQISSIREWQYCGSFENLNGSGLDTEYGPEKNAVSKTDFNANSNGFLNWYTNETGRKGAYQFYGNHSEYGSGVNYAQVFINNPQEQRVTLRLGSSELAKVWLNDVVVLENTNKGGTDLDAYNVEITLPQGTNRLLVKNADKSGSAYFIVRLTDKEGNPIQNLSYDRTFKGYNTSTAEAINAQGVTHPIEAFFQNRLKESPDDFFLTFCLMNTYLRNSKYAEAKEILLPLIEKYPSSSFLKKYLIKAYSKEGDYTSVKELQDNIKKDDAEYYLSYVYKFEDTRELFKLPIAEFEETMKEFSEATDMPIFRESAKMLTYLRKEDKKAIKKQLELITTKYKDQVGIVKLYVSLYSSYLNEEDKAQEVLEDLNDTYFDYGVTKKLIRLYDKQNKKKKVFDLFKSTYEVLKDDGYFLKDYIAYLHEDKQYEESLPLIDQLLANYPYSFVAMEYKGTALEQMNKKKEALVYYERSLKHNGNNSSLRKKIEDLSDGKNYFEKLATQDIYDFIAENRNKGTKNNYGYNYLLDESLSLLFPEGGGKSQTRYIVEITSDSGIESLKEVNLGLGGYYDITKSEIVKPNKKVVPASRSGSNMVFNNLEIGDVIYIDYESSYSKSGRFYKDHVDYFQFDSYHPVFKTVVKVLVPKGKDFEYKVMNGEIAYKKDEVDDYVVHQWEVENAKVLPQQEDYMPSMSDISTYLHIGTIKSWDDIANWYSDLVRPQVIVNSDVKDAFKSVFPEGIANLSEDEKASKIYYYIMENFSYSHVGFRQSGYVPQQPSKTIKSKLGDCKDFSTLYVTLAEMAGLKSHLVLVLTSDYGRQATVMPSQDFNHCIAKVFIDGKPQYLELTDNNMPYKAIPTSLENATALDIPNKLVNDVRSGAYSLTDIAHTATLIESHVEYTLSAGAAHQMKIETILNGSINSRYAATFKETNPEVVKTKIEEGLQGRLKEDFKLNSVYDIEYDLRSPVIKYSTDLTINEKIDEIGKMKVFSIPSVTHAYNSSIISEEDRKYPIEYLLYENVDIYRSNYVVLIDEDQQFVEVPESTSLSFKAHKFNITYELVKANELHVNIEATPSKDRIAAEDYKEFKTYVKAVLDAKTQLIGYKKAKTSISK